MEEETASKIEPLLDEYREQRTALKKMIEELEKVKENISRLFPESMDKRYLYAFEQKVKSATELFKAILEIRKEVSKNIKDEIEIRRKLGEGGLGGEDEETDVSIAKMAKKVEELNSGREQKEKVIDLRKG